jgi:hypothetical protein
MTTWTTPRTWVTGEVLSSTNFNTHIRDNQIYYGGTDSLSTTPPATPGNGQAWTYLVDNATTGVYWDFRYSTALSRWIFIGGGPLQKEVFIGTQTPGATYVALSTPISFTVPRAGLYLLRMGAGYNPQAGNTGYVTVKKGAAAAADADSVNPGALTNAYFGSRSSEATLAASDVVQLMLRNTNAGAAMTNVLAYLEIIPKYIT